MKYIYWFKQQAVALTAVTIWWGICYIICTKMGWREVIILTPDYVVMLVSYALTFIFIGPFIYKWWDPTNENN